MRSEQLQAEITVCLIIMFFIWSPLLRYLPWRRIINCMAYVFVSAMSNFLYVFGTLIVGAIMLSPTLLYTFYHSKEHLPGWILGLNFLGLIALSLAWHLYQGQSFKSWWQRSSILM